MDYLWHVGRSTATGLKSAANICRWLTCTGIGSTSDHGEERDTLLPKASAAEVSASTPKESDPVRDALQAEVEEIKNNFSDFQDRQAVALMKLKIAELEEKEAREASGNGNGAGEAGESSTHGEINSPHYWKLLGLNLEYAKASKEMEKATEMVKEKIRVYDAEKAAAKIRADACVSVLEAEKPEGPSSGSKEGEGVLFNALGEPSIQPASAEAVPMPEETEDPSSHIQTTEAVPVAAKEEDAASHEEKPVKTVPVAANEGNPVHDEEPR
ncbi:hypothetical protein BJ508DRAFT_2839 [Ascobolus immersus RN42]|uniref:Uncharacterized protein n=1 Tax=Ascobolus immersus RN42 TaxID=1160509 RepID=A0A3N4IRS4_ASCIM|nr:hypothetical protein BJ508DRAFT_2839 [Ascobolus immersus RN42]